MELQRRNSLGPTLSSTWVQLLLWGPLGKIDQGANDERLAW